MRKETNEYSFIPTDKEVTLAGIEEKYGKYKKESNEKYVERHYKFNDGSFIKVYKDSYKDGKKERNGKIFMHGRDEDYREFREKDMRLNSNHVEDSNTDSPLISELNFQYKTIGSDETGKGEPFKYLVITAAYVDGASDVEKYIKLGIDDSKEIAGKISKIGEQITHVQSWEELLKRLNGKNLFVTDCSVTKIIINEEYNRRCCEKGENVNDIIKEAHLEVIGEVYNNHSDSMIVVDSFYDNRVEEIEKLKKELCSGKSPMDSNHVFMTSKADSKIMAVSLASVISAYICNLGFDYLQRILKEYKMDPNEELKLHKGSKNADDLSELFSKLKKDRREEFIDKYVKKDFSNVSSAIK